MASNVMVSPGVQVNVVDQSQYTPATNPPENAFGIIGTGISGPIGIPTLIESQSDFESTFGIPVDQSGQIAVATLNAGGTIYYVRAAAGAKVATAQFNGTTETEGETATIIFSGKYPGTIVPENYQLTAKVSVAGTTDPSLADGNTSTVYAVDIVQTAIGGTADVNLIPTFNLSFVEGSRYYYENLKLDQITITVNGEPTGFEETTTESGSEITPVNFTGGDNGLTAISDALIGGTDAQAGINALTGAINALSDPEGAYVILLAAPYYSQIQQVAQYLASTASGRMDCVAQIDHPLYMDNTGENTSSVVSDVYATADAIVKFYSTIDTSFAAAWAGGVIAIDIYTGNEEIYVPSMAILPGLARMYQSYPLWNAPAGASRLSLSNVIRLTHEWTQAERDTLYAGRVNPISNYKSLGYTSMGQKTLQVAATSLDRLNVRMLVNYMKINIEQLSVPFLFMPIDQNTFDSWSYSIGNFCQGIYNQRGLYEFRVKMDYETVTAEAINNNTMPGIVWIKPTKTAEFIPIDLIIKNYADVLE